jgi:hypothetical protein
MELKPFPETILAALIGALIPTIINIIWNWGFYKKQLSRSQSEQRVKILEGILEDYQALQDLFRNYGIFSANVVFDEEGNPVADGPDRYKVEYKILEPIPENMEAIKKYLGDIELDEKVNQTIVKIKLSGSKIKDTAHLLDSSGKLEKDFNELYLSSVYRMEQILKSYSTNNVKTYEEFDNAIKEFFNALVAADKKRQAISSRVQRYVK